MARSKRTTRKPRIAATAIKLRQSDFPVEPLERRLMFAAISWVGSVSGNFNNPANWNTDTVPGTADQVTISAPLGVVVTVSDAEAIQSLTMTTPVVISSPTPSTASLAIEGGGVSINASDTLQIGSGDPTSSGALNFVGSQSLNGGGMVLFAGTAANPNQITEADAVANNPSSLDISGVTIHGSWGKVAVTSTDASIFNTSTIKEDGNGTITLEGGTTGSFSSDGTVGASNGVLDLEGAWVNSDGTLSVSATGTFDLGGTFSDTSADSVTNTGGTVNITGVMSVSTGLLLTSATGSFNLDGGVIEPSSSSNENIINASSGVDLVMTSAGGTLNDMQLGAGAPLDASAGTLLVTSLLTLNSTTINLGGTINFSGTQTLGGTGTIVMLGGSLETTGGGVPQTAATLTVGNGITVNGGDGSITGVNADDSITNTGNLGITAGGELIIKPGPGGTFANHGVLSASNGILDLLGNWSNSGQLLVSGSGNLALGGTFTSNDVNSINASGGVVNITGTLTIEGTLSLTSTTGSFNLDGGSVISGDGTRISTDGTAALVLTTAGGTLNGILLGSGSPLNASTGTVTILNNLNTEATVVTVGATMVFSGSQFLLGGGIFTLAGGALEASGDGGANPATLTIDSGFFINGTSGSLVGLNAGDSIVNEAEIDVNGAGSGITIHGGTNGTFTNSGQITAEGGTLSISGDVVNQSSISVTAGSTANLGDQSPATVNPLTNTGVIIATDSTVNLGGVLTPAALGNFNRTGGTVNITGLFNLLSAVQTFSPATGNVNLEGGTIEGPGTIDSSGNDLVLTAAGGALSGGVTLGSGTPVDASAGLATVSNGLILTGTALNLGGGLNFAGTQTLGGTGTITLAGKLSAMGDGGANPATLTIGSGIAISGASGSIGGLAAGDSIVNDGTISATKAGSTISLFSNGGSITNAGTLSLVPQSAISVTPNLVTTATSTIAAGIDSTGIGSLDVTGTATLAGTLSVGVAIGFVPPQGQVYTLVNYAATNGSFTTINGLTPTGAVLTPAAAATSYTLTTTFGAYSGLRPTALTVVSSAQSAAAGSPVTFTATVAAPAGDGLTPTGTVSFFLNGAAFGTAAVQPNETAIFTTSSLPSGLLMITAVYSGDTAYASSASAVLGENIAAPVETIGGLSPTFGTQGLASHSVGFTATSGVAVSAGGQSIVAGTIGTAPSESFGITRYNADGSLDTTFGTGGVATYTFGATDDRVASISVLPGGQLLVAGTATTYTAGVVTGSEFALAEFNPDGTLDTSFGNGTGEVLTSFSTTAGTLSNDVVHTMIVGTNGTIYLGGSSDAGGHGEDFAIAAYTAAGALSTGFNTTGTATLDFSGGDDQINSLALQADGSVVAAGFATVGGVAQIALARFLPTGILDKRFGTLGTVTTTVGGVFDSAASVVIQPGGQILIGGVSATGSGSSLSADFVLARYTTTGRIDRTFGGGPVITSFSQPSAITQVVLEPDGEIIASGKTTASLTSVVSSQLDVAVARYTANGALDTTFNGSGKTIINLSGSVAPTGVQIGTFSQTVIRPLGASGLGDAFDQFISSQQGVIATTTGGAILDAGSSGTNTVEAEIIVAGVDLVAGVVSALPTAVPGGMKGTATISIGENGTTLAKGTVTIELQFATDAQGDGAKTVESVPERISLHQGASHVYKLAFVFPAGIPANNYFLVATVEDGSSLTDLNANNNIALSTHTVDISPPTIILAGSDLTATTAFTPGKPVGISLEITNNGNILAHGRIVLELFLSTNDTTAGTQIAAPAMAVALAAGKSRLTRLKFALPKTTTAGTFNLLALLDPTDALGSTDHSDTLVVDVTPVAVG